MEWSKHHLVLPPRAEWPKFMTPDWLVEGWFENRDIVVWGGEPGIGKSVITLAMALGLASGQPMLGFWPHPTGKPLRIAILDLENRGDVILRRLVRLSEGLGIDIEAIYDKSITIFGLRGYGLFDSNGMNMSVLKDMLAFKPQLTVLDTLMSATTQETLSPLEGVRFIRDTMMNLSEKLGCGWHVLGHLKKRDPKVPKGSTTGDQDQLSGGGFVGMADALVMVQRDANDQIVVTNPKQRHQVNDSRFYIQIDDHGLDDGPLDISMSETPFVILPHETVMFETLKPLLPQRIPEAADLIAKNFKMTDRSARRWINSWLAKKLIENLGKEHPLSRGKDGHRADVIALFNPFKEAD